MRPGFDSVPLRSSISHIADATDLPPAACWLCIKSYVTEKQATVWYDNCLVNKMFQSWN